MQILDIHMTHPALFIIGTIATIVWVYLFLRGEKNNSIYTPNTQQLSNIFGIHITAKIMRVVLLFMIGIWLSFIASRPYIIGSDVSIKKDGIDIVVVLDVSKSMDFNDFQPSRLDLAKTTLINFVSEITSDRVWLIVFAGKPISSQPLTFDYAIINETVAALSTDIINQNVPGLSGTNIWDSLLLAKGLFDLPDREKVVLLITDGDANSWADPQLVASLLSEEKITIYPIGIGKNTETEVMVNNWFFQQKQIIPPLNTATLQTIADETNWIFFRAWDNTILKEIFKKLQQLQTSEIQTQVKKYKQDYSLKIVYIVIILLSLLIIIELTYPRCK